jgi:peptidyl-prolyl cis-trans isomerase D
MPEDILLEMVKEEIISQKTLLSQTRDMGILVSENDAKQQIMISPNFQTDGQFDEIAFETAIRTQGYTPNDYISIVTEGMAKNYLIDSIASSFFTLDNEILDIAKLIEQERDITFTKIDFNVLKSTIQADLTEAKAYYESNSINFFSNEERSMNYITIKDDDYRSLVEVPDNYLEEAYEDYLQRIEMRSEKRASHIMVDLMNYPSKAEALKIITLAEKELNSGKDFNEVVRTYSEDIISKELDGDIGYSSGDVFPDEFENALAKMTKGQVSDIIFSEAKFSKVKLPDAFISRLNDGASSSRDKLSKIALSIISLSSSIKACDSALTSSSRRASFLLSNESATS